MKKALFFLVAASFLSFIGTARADMLQVTFSGDIDWAYDQGPLLGTTSISDSSTFVGQFIYNTDTSPTSSSSYYASYSIEPGFTITVDGTYVFGVNNPGVGVTNNEPAFPSGVVDELVAGGSWLDGLILPFSTSGVDISNFVIGIWLRDYTGTGTALDSTSLPDTINLAAFDQKFINIYANYFSLDGQFAYDLDIVGTVTSLNVAPIPEPSTMLLLGSGLLGLWGLRRRVRK